MTKPFDILIEAVDKKIARTSVKDTVEIKELEELRATLVKASEEEYD